MNRQQAPPEDVPLIVFEELLLVAQGKIVRHRVCPLERHTTPEDDVDGLLHELDLNPGELGRDLHLLHLLLRLLI